MDYLLTDHPGDKVEMGEKNHNSQNIRENLEESRKRINSAEGRKSRDDGRHAHN